ncbi:MAG TPA: hypothetical protein VGL21_05290 [Jatrophihabitantaceae bacterium]|jgi:hypothetical protein
MHVNDYVEQVHDQMRAAAALGDERTQQIAGTLAATADASVRLALLAAVSTAAAEITAALYETNGGPAVTVAVDGDELRVDIAQAPQPAATEPPPADDLDRGDATARISLRLSERLKSDIEEAAGRDGISVNTWLVRAAGAAIARPGGPGGSGGPGWGGPGWGGPGWAGPNWGGGPGWGGPGGPPGRGSHRVTGWVTG